MTSKSENNNINIRKGTSDDLDSIEDIINLVVPIMNKSNNFQWALNVYPLRKDFEKDISDGILYVAYDNNDKVVGCIALDRICPIEYKDAGCDVSEKCIVPHRLAVDPSFQGKGIALTLMKRGIELAIENNYKYVRVDTNTINVKMQAIFERLGFNCRGEIKLIGKPENLTFLCYELEIK